MSPPPVVVCDPGIDDMLALMVLAGLGIAPAAVVATAGNVDLDTACDNASALAAALGFACPVAPGAGAALTGPYPDAGAPFHGPDGLGGIADRFRVRATAPSEPGGVALIGGQVLATGPLTVVARALDAGRGIEKVTWMGGSVGAGGNITAAAEYNAWLDPEAADLVLTSGADVAVVPLDVTRQVPLTADDIDHLAGCGPTGALAATACRYVHDRDGTVYPHDATAAIAHVHPELFRWERRSVRCETAGVHTRGATVVDRRRRSEPGAVRVAVEVDGPAVRRLMRLALRRLA